MRTDARALALCTAALLAACDVKRADDLQTSELRPMFEAVATGPTRTHLAASLFKADDILTFVELGTGDRFVGATGAQSATMQRESSLAHLAWVTDFGTGAEGTAFRVALQRATKVSAPLSEATLPAAFELAQPLQGASFSRGEAIPVSWGPAGAPEELEITLLGDCTGYNSVRVPADTGSFSIPAGTLAAKGGDRCDVTLSLRRVRQGTVDPAFAPGSFVGVQERSVVIHSTP